MSRVNGGVQVRMRWAVPSSIGSVIVGGSSNPEKKNVESFELYFKVEESVDIDEPTNPLLDTVLIRRIIIATCTQYTLTLHKVVIRRLEGSNQEQTTTHGIEY